MTADLPALVLELLRRLATPNYHHDGHTGLESTSLAVPADVWAAVHFRSDHPQRQETP